MTRRLALVLTTFLIVLSATSSARQSSWRIDPAHSKVSFVVTKWGFMEVEGKFREHSGTIAFDPAKPETGSIEWTVKVASVDTGELRRDQTLQDEEYFHAARYPDLTFKSASIKPAGANRFDVTGTLTMRGVAKTVTLPVTYGGRHDVPGEGLMDVFQTSFVANRFDFGIRGGSVMRTVISRDVTISLVAASRPTR